MKTVFFLGQEWLVPEWAEWITQDSAGLVLVHEKEPKCIFDDSSGTDYYRSAGQTEELFFPSSTCMKI